VLHKTIKIEEDTERFSYNTAVSAFMICVNELTDLKCHKRNLRTITNFNEYSLHHTFAEELWHHIKSPLKGRFRGLLFSLDASLSKLRIEKYLN